MGGTAFQQPTWVGGAPGDSSTLYVAEKDGVLWRKSGSRQQRVLDLTSIVRSGDTEFDEDGLLSVAFARDFRSSGHLFVYFTRRPDGAGQVRRYTMRSGSIVAGSARTILTAPMPPNDVPAEAGGTVWTTDDGMLWLSTGDGGTQGTRSYAQDLSRLQGKILRVKPGRNGGHVIPADNPFVGRRGARGEIWALGLRQPWRVQLDAPTGDLWVTDVGQESREEINRLRDGAGRGANFGWPRIEGDRTIHPNVALTRGTPLVRPFVTWDHSSTDPCHAVMGGGVYRGPIASLRGWYVYANLCGATVSAINPATRRTVSGPGAFGIDAFGTTSTGAMFAASAFNGRIYRVVAG